MTQSLNSRKSALETQLSKIEGCPVEITIRGLHEFTVSSEGKHTFDKVKSFLSQTGALSDWSPNYDPEDDFSWAFFNLNQPKK